MPGWRATTSSIDSWLFLGKMSRMTSWLERRRGTVEAGGALALVAVIITATVDPCSNEEAPPQLIRFLGDTHRLGILRQVRRCLQIPPCPVARPASSNM